MKADQLSLQHEHESRLLAESKSAAAQPQLEDEKSKVDQHVRELQELTASHAAAIDDALLEQETRRVAQLCHREQELRNSFKEQTKTLIEARMKAEQFSLKQDRESRLCQESKEAAAQSQLEATKSKADQYLRELQELSASHAATILSQAEVHDNLMKDPSKALEQLKLLHDAELEQLRRMSIFFKNNSERLSRSTKKMAATIRTLQNTEQNSLLSQGLIRDGAELGSFNLAADKWLP